MMNIMRGTLHGLACALSAGLLTLEAATPRADTVLRNEFLALGFDARALHLVSVKDPQTNHEFLESRPETPILWRLELETPEGEPFTLNSALPATRQFKRSTDGQMVTLTWTGPELQGEKHALTVRVIVQLPAGTDRSYWRIEVDNDTSSSLMRVQFPHLSGISKAGQPSAAIPRHNWGNLEPSVTYTRGSYPCDIWPMQFLALLEKDSGLYLAYEDPTSAAKYFDLTPGETFFFTSFVEGATQPGNDFVSPGAIAVGVCGPDWWKAAKMYRAWAIAQPWTKRGPLAEPSNIPEAAKQIGIWFNEFLTSGGTETQVERIKAAAEFYQLPIAMQIYNWHRAAFDTEYPEYFPPRPGFVEILKTLTSLGAFGAPYVNGRLQDVQVASSAAAKPWMIKKRDGTSPIEDYQSGAKLAVMCPATEYWQKTMIDTAAQLVAAGANAVYYDQIGAAEPYLCFDPSHNHPIGGSACWVEGYRKMLSGVKSLPTPTGIPLLVTTENNAECYMDTVDGFLTWTPRSPNEIPLLTAVYSGYTIYFGSNAQVEEHSGLGPFAMIVGRDLLWGTQPGWMSIDLESDRGAYLRDVARVRHANRKFFQFGELVGELKPRNDPGTVTGTWKNVLRDGVAREATLPAVMSSVWKARDGSLGIAVANLSGEERTFSYQINPSDFGVTLPENAEWVLTQTPPVEGRDLGTAPGSELARDETLKPWEFRVIELAPRGKRSVAGAP